MEHDGFEPDWPAKQFETLGEWRGVGGMGRPSLIGAHLVCLQDLWEFHQALEIAIEYVEEDLAWMTPGMDPAPRAETDRKVRELRAAVAKVAVAVELVDQCQQTVCSNFPT